MEWVKRNMRGTSPWSHQGISNVPFLKWGIYQGPIKIIILLAESILFVYFYIYFIIESNRIFSFRYHKLH